MIWFIDEYLDKVIRSLELCPGVDITIDTHEIQDEDYDICISIFWHKPSLNLHWYPICQIDLNGRTIFHHEGGENPESWSALLNAAVDRLSEKITTNKGLRT